MVFGSCCVATMAALEALLASHGFDQDPRYDWIQVKKCWMTLIRHLDDFVSDRKDMGNLVEKSPGAFTTPPARQTAGAPHLKPTSFRT